MTGFTEMTKDYDAIYSFLTENELEDEKRISGYSDEEIKEFEDIRGISFPLPYKLFLQYFGKGSMRFFCGQTFKLEKIRDAEETARELLKERNESLNEDCFVFSQWQGYNFYYYEQNHDDVFVCLYEEGRGTSIKWSFKEWMKWQIEADLKGRERMEKMEIQELLKKLNTL